MYMRKNAVRGQLYSGFSPSVSRSLRLNSGHQASQQVPLVLNHLTGLVSHLFLVNFICKHSSHTAFHEADPLGNV